MKGVGDRYDRCIRCGDRVPWGRSVCRRCNPADLPSPSPTQYHATVFLVVILSLVFVAGWLILRG
jgi:hypothetical protein